MKKYYRLEELKELFGFSQSDINYLIVESNVQFCLYCKTARVIIGGWREGKFICFGQAKYSGLISINADQQIELFEKDKLTLTQSKLLQKSKILDYQTAYPFKVLTPNTVIDEWYEKAIDSIKWEYLPFRFYPEERKSNIKMFEGIVEQISAYTDFNTTGKRPKDTFPNPLVTVKNELFFHWKRFNLDDVCIQAEELKKALQLMGNTEAIVCNPVPVEESLVELKKEIKTRTDDFNDLMIEIMKAKPKKTAKEYWRLLECESEEMEGFRMLDKYNLLIGVTGNNIKWQDRSGKPRKSISFSAFSNRLSKVRKEVYFNKEN